MKIIIVYYSASGNTAKIAKAIYLGMKSVNTDCNITKIKDISPNDLIKYDLIGIGGPIWGGRESTNLSIFLHNMPDLTGKLGFPFCVHGAQPIGFMYHVSTVMQKKGLTIIGYNDWYGSVYLPYMPKPYYTDGHPDEIDLKEAEEFGKEMAMRGQRILAGEKNLIPELPSGEENILWRPRKSPKEEGFEGFESDKKGESERPPERPQRQLKINMTKCTYPKCTLCVDHCPMNSIDFSVTPPVIKANCRGDNLCEAICPTGAIEGIDFEAIFKTHGLGARGFVKYLKDDEARGHFRWLVPEDNIGWDTPNYKVTGHPRITIEED
jgi:flavodoxin/ferredoxin